MKLKDKMQAWFRRHRAKAMVGAGLALTTAAQASGGVPSGVQDAFDNAVSVVQTVGAAGLLVVAAWVVFLVAKKGLSMFGKG